MKSTTTKKCRQIAGNFDHHADAAVQCRAHRPLEHIQGFTRSHWMLPSGEYMCLIAQAAAMIDKLVAKHQTRTKHFLPSDYRPVLFKNRVTFGTQNRPSTQHVETTSCVKM